MRRGGVVCSKEAQSSTATTEDTADPVACENLDAGERINNSASSESYNMTAISKSPVFVNLTDIPSPPSTPVIPVLYPCNCTDASVACCLGPSGNIPNVQTSDVGISKATFAQCCNKTSGQMQSSNATLCFLANIEPGANS